MTKIKEIPVTIENLKDVIDYAWERYQDKNTKFYPVVDKRDDLESIYKQAFMFNDLWLYEYEGVWGVFPLIEDHEMMFVQANGGLAAIAYFDVFMETIEERLHDSYKDYIYAAGYPSSNVAAIDYHEKHQYVLDEVALRYELDLNHFSTVQTLVSIEHLMPYDFENFKSFHKSYVGDVYWTATQIISHLERWVVLLEKDENDELVSIAGAITFEKDGEWYAEIYFVEGESPLSSILVSLINALKDQSIQNILYLVEEKESNMIEMLEGLGFELKDDYLSFRKMI